MQARLDRVDVFRRQRDPGDAEGLDPAIEDDAQVRARRDRIRLRESLVDQRAADIARRGPGATPQMQPIERLVAAVHQRDHARRHRQRRGRQVDDEITHDPRLDRDHARNLGEPRHDRERRPLDRHEHVGKPGLLVEPAEGRLERIVGRHRRDEHGNAGGDQQRDGDDLRAHGGEIAHELAIEQAHQLNSSGDSRRALRSIATMRPPPSRSTRSAMPAIAALWVMITIVVPSSLFTRAIAASTSLPVS